MLVPPMQKMVNLIRKKSSLLFQKVKALFVFIALLFFLSLALANEDDTNHFYFVQITDTHWGDGNHIERTRKIVRRINELPMKIQCVVHTGDITFDNIEDRKIVAKGLSELKKLKVPIHFVPGNHDILRHKREVTQQVFKDQFGDLFIEKEYSGVVFILVYTEPMAQSFSVEGYQPLIELEEVVKRTQGKPAIIFHHTPSVDDFYKNRMHDGWQTEVQEKWKSLLNTYNVKAVIAGHFHRDEHHWLGKVPLYVCPPVAGYLGRQAAFRIYEYKDGKIGYRTQYIP